MVVDLANGQASVVGKIPCGYVYVDGLSVGEVTETSLKDRRILGEEGFVSVMIVVDSTSGKLATDPEIHARGSGIDDASLSEVRPADRGGPRPRGGGGDHRCAPAGPAGAAHGGTLGKRDLPAAADDHSRGYRDLSCGRLLHSPGVLIKAIPQVLALFLLKLAVAFPVGTTRPGA